MESRLRDLRRAGGLTQAELARRAGLSLQEIGHLESGRRRPRMETARAIAAALGVTLDAIWPITPDESAPADVRSPA